MNKKPILILLILGACLGFYRLLRPVDETVTKTSNSISSAYVKEKKTLQEWQKLNKNIKFILELWDQYIPVVQGKDNQFYVEHNIYNKQDKYGTPFLDASNSLEDDQLFIFGHSSSKKDLLFTKLKNLALHQNQEIILDNGTEKTTYKFFAMLKLEEEDLDKYMGWYKFEIDDKKQFINQLNQFTSVYVKPKGIIQKILTLITCNLDTKNGRYIVFFYQ